MRNNRKRNLKKLVKNIITATTLSGISLNSMNVSASDKGNIDANPVGLGIAGLGGLAVLGIFTHWSNDAYRTGKKERIANESKIRKLTSAIEQIENNKEQLEKDSRIPYNDLLRITETINTLRREANLTGDKTVEDVVNAVKTNEPLTIEIVDLINCDAPLAKVQLCAAIRKYLTTGYSLDKRKEIINDIATKYMLANGTKAKRDNSILKVCRATGAWMAPQSGWMLQSWKACIPTGGTLELWTWRQPANPPGAPRVRVHGNLCPYKNGVNSKDSYVSTATLLNKTLGDLLGDILTLHFAIEPAATRGQNQPGPRDDAVCKVTSEQSWLRILKNEAGGGHGLTNALNGDVDIFLTLSPTQQLRENIALAVDAPGCAIPLRVVEAPGGFQELDENYKPLRKKIFNWWYAGEMPDEKLEERDNLANDFA